ncbi:MAG: ATP-grasp domain-containing protein [Ruminococcus flavefaciens]|nr:ATP-grasp domain-containing protein [Ruminococcus flavefaciens]MCM1228694.1 ATP-grasp domain-containing protein [Ruminococcus flavefaciens]
MVDLILFPSSYFSVNRVDEDLQKEFDAVRETGLFGVVLFGYDKWFNEGKLVLNKTFSTPHNAVMRGWMMKPEQYRIFYKELYNKNIHLITEPKEYALMHFFPNVYGFFGDDTAKMKIYPLYEQINIEEVKKSFNRFMIKDFVKSVKGTEFPRFFDNSVTQEEFDKFMEIFYKYRGSLLSGGICVKEFLNLKFYNEKSNEYRVFYINNEIATVSRNSGQENCTQAPPAELLEKYKNLSSHYYTVDYAELTDGTWKVIEAGDGSVSGLSQNQSKKQYFRLLYNILNK